MKNNRVKYLVMVSIEEDMDVMGIYESKEKAFSAMKSDFCKAIGVKEDALDEWLEENDDAGIDEFEARALDTTTQDGSNHDWKIIPLVCDGECRVANEQDFNIVEATYNTNCDSGAVYSSPCLVDTTTGEVTNVGMAGEMCEDDAVSSVTVTIGDDQNEFDVCDVQAVLDENDTEDALEILEDVFKTKNLWIYNEGSLEDAIMTCKEQLADEAQ